MYPLYIWHHVYNIYILPNNINKTCLFIDLSLTKPVRDLMLFLPSDSIFKFSEIIQELIKWWCIWSEQWYFPIAHQDIGLLFKTRGLWATSLIWDTAPKNKYICAKFSKRLYHNVDWEGKFFSNWGLFILTNLNPLHSRMLCAKFGCN